AVDGRAARGSGSPRSAASAAPIGIERGCRPLVATLDPAGGASCPSCCVLAALGLAIRRPDAANGPPLPRPSRQLSSRLRSPDTHGGRFIPVTYANLD